MKHLVKGQVNTVVVTLYEKTTLSPVYYLFEFTPKGTKVPAYCIPDEQSTQLQRYNMFFITVNDEGLTYNEVILPPGECTYRVYEQSVNDNTDPTGLRIVEEKTCFVDKAATPAVEYSGAETTNVEYNP